METLQIEIGEMAVDVVFKNIKNVHLSVYPPNGRVRIAAPERMKIDTIRVYVISRLDWIKKQQQKLAQQLREGEREYVNREDAFAWGHRYLLKVDELDGKPGVMLQHTQMVLTVRPGASAEKRQALMAEWYRQEIRNEMAAMIAKWEPLLGVKASKWFIQRMKTRWGSCNPNTGNIRLNSELARKPRECLEYVILHELVHLIEPSHNEHFQVLMNKSMPLWRNVREELNRAPLAHEDWEY